jgi:hypothetical protein
VRFCADVPKTCTLGLLLSALLADRQLTWRPTTAPQEIIKASQRQFLQHYVHARGLAAMMLERCQQSSDYTKQLHLIYLINDILVHRF